MAEQAGRRAYSHDPFHTRPVSEPPNSGFSCTIQSIAQPHSSSQTPLEWPSAPSTSSNFRTTTAAFDRPFRYVSTAARDKSQLSPRAVSAGSNAGTSDSLVHEHWGWTKGNDETISSIETPRHEEIEVEEITGSDIGYDSDIEIIRPDQVEDADKEEESSSREKSQDRESDEASFLDRFRQLSCGSIAHIEDAGHAERLARKKKRWSSGILKRTYSQSNLGSDTDGDGRDELDGHDLDSSARRLRRRVGVSDARSPLIFEDLAGGTVTETEELVAESPAVSCLRDWNESMDSSEEQPATPSGSSMEIDSDADPP